MTRTRDERRERTARADRRRRRPRVTCGHGCEYCRPGARRWRADQEIEDTFEEIEHEHRLDWWFEDPWFPEKAQPGHYRSSSV